jgi:hypothetical protein
MAYLINSQSCPECGHAHELCFQGEEYFVSFPYWYVCPVTGKEVTIRQSPAVEMPKTCPIGSVECFRLQSSPASNT